MSADTPEQRGFDLRRFLFSGSGWPYLLVPFIPVAIVLELTHASATLIFTASALGVIPTAALIAAPMTGLVTLAVHGGTTLQAGTPVAMIEAMNMKSTIMAPLTGTVARAVAATGTRVEQGDLILVIAPNADERAKIAALS